MRSFSSLLILIVLIIAAVLLISFLIKLNMRDRKKEAIYAFTVQDFMNNHIDLNENTEQKVLSY
ncbi:hypothetical protein (plasmid) [Metabacillus dongyingensis]|nr:hypothetical protein [Metabacillus dongyingensis]